VSFSTIVCAVDFAAASMRGLDYARRLASGGGRIELVHTVEWPFGSGDAPMPPEIEALRASLEREALAHLRRFTGTTQRPDLTLDAFVATGKPYAHILQRARGLSADLIVLGLHSHATSDLALLGSTARRVLQQAPCPVLTVGVT
jgi:nucleotide-binding universal stress UspA family protein